MAKEILRSLEESIRPGETGPDGRYEMRLRLPGSAAVFVRVRARGYLQREVCIGLEEREPDRTADLVLEPAYGIEGRIVDQEGWSVRGATVFGSSGAGQSTGARSDEEGRYRILDAPGGDVQVLVRPPTNPRGTWGRGGLQRWARSGDRDVDFVLTRLDGFGARVVIEVVEPGTERPPVVKHAGRIPLSDVGMWRSRVLPVPERIEPGRVLLDGMEPGRWRLWVELEDGRVRYFDFDLADGQKESKGTLAVQGTGGIRGEVDLAGLSFGRSSPAVHLRLAGTFRVPDFVASDHPDHYSAGAAVREDGSFECAKLSPGTYVVEIGPGIGISASARVEVIPGRTAPCRLVATKDATLAVRVTTPDGGGTFSAWTWSGVADPAHRGNRELKDRVTEVEWIVHPGAVRWEGRFVGRSGADGRFPEPVYLDGSLEVSQGESKVLEIVVPATKD